MVYTPDNPSQIAVGPGTLYAAPLGTAEPLSATGALGTGWLNIGYTSGGSTFTRNVTTATVTVEEEIYPLQTVATDASAELAFNLAEINASNLLMALNAGVGTSVQASSFTTLTDGSIKVEPPAPGNETRIMLAWDAKSSGGAATSTGSRLLIRQAFQTGNISVARQKGNTLSTFACTFTAEKPVGKELFAFYFDQLHLGYQGA